MAVVYKIHPAIGVARVGNAPDEFYIGPESEDEDVNPPGGFKDAQCRLKRQAVRFRIYQYDDVTGAEEEITDQVTDLTWHFEPRCGKDRNGTDTFSGASVSGRLDRATFSGSIQIGMNAPASVQLGELRTDDEQRLIFLGGLGVSAPIPGSGASPPLLLAYDPRWYDDICEGPVTATFTHGGSPRGPIQAWALSAPPRSAPHSPPASSFYTQLVAAATAAGRVVAAATPGSRHALDKSQLHFVSGVGPGIEVYISSALADYASKFEASDPLRVVAGFTQSLFTLNLPSPWQADAYSCTTWAVWSAAGFGTREEFRMNWPRRGLALGDGSSVEQCDAALMITLITPSIDFGQVPERPGSMIGSGLRAIEFDITTTMAGVELEYQTAPSGPFAADGPAPGPVGPTGGAKARVRFWVRYSTTANPADDATVVIRRVGAPAETWTIPLHAETVARRVTATALVLDRSGSMWGTAADGTAKHVMLRSAAKRFIDLALLGDSIQLVRYDETAEAVPAADTGGVSGSGATALTATTRPELRGIVDGPDFTPDGSTSIGAGIQRGQERLALVTAPATHKAMVILTDGMENTPPYVADVASIVDSSTYAIGLGSPTNTSAPVLQALAGNHGGYLLVTGNVTTGSPHQFLLDKYFLQILAGINSAEVVLDPSGVLVAGGEVSIPFSVTEHDAGFEAILVSNYPGAVDYRLLSPSGLVLEPRHALAEPTLEFALTEGLSYFRVALPAELRQGTFDKAGTWHALLRIGKPRVARESYAFSESRAGDDVSSHTAGKLLHSERQRLLARAALAGLPEARQGRVPYTFLVHSYSSVALRAWLRQESFEPGAKASLRATLLDSGALPLAETRITAEVTRPDGSPFELGFSRVSKQPGHYAATLVTSQPGVYRCRVLARARSAECHSIQREQTLTAQVWYGGDRPVESQPAEGEDERQALRSLLCCLTSASGAVSPELWARLERAGIDVARLRRCLERFCKRRPGPHELARALEAATSKRGG